MSYLANRTTLSQEIVRFGLNLKQPSRNIAHEYCIICKLLISVQVSSSQRDPDRGDKTLSIQFEYLQVNWFRVFIYFGTKAVVTRFARISIYTRNKWPSLKHAVC